MGRILRGAKVFALLAAVVAVLGACDDLRGPENHQNSLRPEGPQATDIDNLFIPVLAISTVVFILVLGAVIYAAWRFRRRTGNENPKQSHGNPIIEFGAVVGSFTLLAVIAVPTVNLIFELDAAPAADRDPLEVTVVGKQWWWEFTYTNLTDEKTEEGAPKPLVTSTELHIPAGRPVVLNLDGRNTVGNTFEATPNPYAGSSPDVIHSFWVPELNGKRDYVPGRLNTWKIEANEPGKFLGQCAEYCGLSHANMRLRVIAMTQSDFDGWVKAQRGSSAEPFLEADGTTPAGPAQALAAQTFQCTNCHVFDDSSKPNYGPNLTHLASRSTIGGGTHVLFETNRLGEPTSNFQLDVLARWIHDATSQAYGAPQSSEGSRWPMPLPEGYSPMPPNQGMPSFAQLSYVPTFLNGEPDLENYPLMSLAEACDIAEYLAAGRPAGMQIDEGACANPSTKPGVAE